MKQKRILAAVTAALCSCSMIGVMPHTAPAVPAQAASTISNPFILSDVPDDDIIRVGDTYYMVHTTMFFTPGVPIMKSKDLFSWEICGYVYDKYADGAKQNLQSGQHDYAHRQWATSLRYYDGKFYVFFGSYGTGNSYIYSTDDIESGNWNRVELRGMYHDASMLFDTDGRKYLVYGGGEIKIKEFNDTMTDFKSGERTLFKTNLSGLAGEGSHIHKVGDYYYVFIIAWPSGSIRTEYCYRSKSLTGEWEGKVVLQSGLGNYGSGVAQGGIINTPDNKWYGLFFQDHGSLGRVPVLVPCTWQNDWPVFGESGKAPTTLTVPDGYKGTFLAKDDDFNYSSNKLDYVWQWNHNPDNSAWSVTDRPGYYRITNKSTASNIFWARNTLTMRTEGPACSGVVKLDTSGMKPGDHAGLSAFQFHYGNVGVYLTNDGTRKIYASRNGGGDEVSNASDKKIEEVNMNGKEIYLKADYQFNNVGSNGLITGDANKANFYYSYDGSSWTKIGDTLNMDYSLKLFTGYRNALYSYGTSNTGGYADFDFFDYERADWNVPTVIEQDPDGYWFHYTFEKGTESFSGRSGETLATSTAEKYAGNQSLAVTGRTASWNGPAHTLSTAVCEPGKAYSFSVNTKYTSGSDSNLFHFTLQYTGADGEVHYDKIVSGTVMKGEWVQLANQSYTIPEDASDMRIYVETDSGSDSFYIDEMICADEGVKIDGAGASSFVLGDVNSDGTINAADFSLAKHGMENEFKNSTAKLAADVDRNGTVTEADLRWYYDFLLGNTKAYPEKADPIYNPSDYDYDPNLQYHEPNRPNENYLDDCAQAGTIVKEYYSGINGSKAMNVYLPYGYDESKKYNVFYLMHGGSENENTCFSNDVKMNKILDHMIKNGEIEPMIVVTPTFNNCPNIDGNGGAGSVWDEMRQTIIPYIESKYSTYAESTTIDGLKASRYHRAYGGFSMGGGSTWNMFINNLDICAYYMPLSGHCWSGLSGIQGAIDKFGFQKDEYYILAATGDQDIAYGNMRGLMDSMKNDTTHFTYTSDFSQGNFYFLLANSNDGNKKTHWWGFVRWYIYDALPHFFHEKQ